MSEEKRIPERLIERIDELLVVLNRLVEDLREISITLKSIAISQIAKPTAPAAATAMPVSPTHKVIEKANAVDDVRMMFPDDLENLLDFEEKEEYIVIKPRQFLGSENFAKIASVVRGMGGDYVSAGKASHFRVPKKRI